MSDEAVSKAAPMTPPRKPPPMPAEKGLASFREHLGRLQRAWRRGLGLASLLRCALVLLLAVAVYGMLDFFLALGAGVRIPLGAALLFAWLGWLAWEWIGHARLGPKEMARRADALSGHRRQPALTALELSGGSGPETGRPPLEAYLVRQSVDEANRSLGGITPAMAFPRELVGRRLKQFAVGAVLVGVVVGAFWPVTSVLLARIAVPWIDVPPYSPYRFVVEPEKPEVFYGEGADVAVTIEGAKVDSPVWFQTRTGPEGPVSRTACFEEGEGRYAQRLEQVVQPVEFSFAIGKARSRWMPVDLLLQPKVALAAATVIPPGYVRQSERNFVIGELPFAGLRGATARLSITSNRPLLDGTLTVNAADASDGEGGRTLEGARTGPRTVTFEWTIEEEADLAVVIRDVRGTSLEEPLTIRQKLIPDEPPRVVISEPALHLMATPSIRVPVAGRAEDDLGLGRVELVRAVIGYRDRMRELTPPSIEKRFDYRDEIDLATLGVRPGETLEFYFEAADRNPSLLGVAASEVARVQIISEEDYANMLRVRTTVEEFSERYRIINEALSEMREAFENLDKAREAGDEKAADEPLAEAARRAAEASELFGALKEDFAAFELEKGVIEQAGATREALESIRQQLEEAGGKASALSEAQIEAMREQLGLQEEAIAAERKQAEEVASVARLMEMAAAFSRIVEEQESLARRLKRFDREETVSEEDASLLEAMGEKQEQLREQLESFGRQLEDRAGELPPEYRDLAESARAFGKALRQTGATGDMEEASSAAGKKEGRDAWQFGALAHEKLAGLLAQPGDGGDEFAAMCQGQMPFQPMSPELKETLEQMLSAIRLRRGAGMGNGQGMPGFGQGGSGSGPGMGGGGGSNNDGYSMPGFTSLDIPVMGPQRMRLQSRNPAPGPQAGGEGDTPGRNKDRIGEVNESDHLEVEHFSDVPGRAGQLDRVPEKYRDAVQRYFTPRDAPEPEDSDGARPD